MARSPPWGESKNVPRSLNLLVFVVTSLVCAAPVAARMFFVPNQSLVVSANPRFVVVDDLDGDGLADAIVVSRRKRVSVLYGSDSSAASLERPIVFEVGRRLRRPTIGDVNADGIGDIAVPDESERGVWILFGRPGRGFLPAQFFPTSLRPRAATLVDLDGVGGDDLVIGERRRGIARALFNASTSSFRPGEILRFPPGLRRLESRDLDGDGSPEIVGLSSSRDGVSVTVFSSNADQSFQERDALSAEARKSSLAIADIDGDGREDLLLLAQARRRSSTDIRISFVESGLTLSPTTIVESPCLAGQYGRNCRSRGIAIADFDGDNVPDLATGLHNQSILGGFGTRRSGVIALMRGRGDTFTSHTSAPWLERVPTDLAAGDFDGDGRIDIVTISRSGSLVQVLKNLSVPDVRAVRQRPDAPTRR